MLMMSSAPAADAVDPDLINTGKQPVTALPGAAFFAQPEFFAMMRGGHLDVCVLGAFEVSQKGDLANWSTGGSDSIPAVGGAMDLAGGARKLRGECDERRRWGDPAGVVHAVMSALLRPNPGGAGTTRGRATPSTRA